MWCKELTHFGKDPDAGKDWGQEEKGTTEDEMVGWPHRLDGHEFEQALGVGDRQRSMACCRPWGRKESDMTERLNWTDMNALFHTDTQSLEEQSTHTTHTVWDNCCIPLTGTFQTPPSHPDSPLAVLYSSVVTYWYSPLLLDGFENSLFDKESEKEHYIL